MSPRLVVLQVVVETSSGASADDLRAIVQQALDDAAEGSLASVWEENAICANVVDADGCVS